MIDSLKKNYQFKIIYNKGKSVANKNLVLYVLRNGLANNRFGVSVSKKVGNSVIRNRVKRLLKENYRLFEKDSLLKQGFDIIVIARLPIADADFHAVKSSLRHCFVKQSIFVHLP